MVIVIIMACFTFVLTVITILLKRYIYINIKTTRGITGTSMGGTWHYLLENKNLKLNAKDDLIVYAYKYALPLTVLCIMSTFLVFVIQLVRVL
ncbi:hypothetical protein CKA38_11185 [Ereboglobus luteus]|uniref:Uncharacterized protein n=1 Tax=Ereboglobus luteus TaxID=1796921 RepID=A0A2U8E4J7_9BACT|nr:hypothetical protein CKA38_11185 [Ereboglobus luteus]